MNIHSDRRQAAGAWQDVYDILLRLLVVATIVGGTMLLCYVTGFSGDNGAPGRGLEASAWSRR